MPRSFGRRVKQRAEELGLSLRKVAREAKMNPAFLAKIVRGDRKPPSDKKIEAVAQALKIPFVELLIAAGRIPEDLGQDVEGALPDFFRAAKDLTEEEIRAVVQAFALYRERGEKTQ